MIHTANVCDLLGKVGAPATTKTETADVSNLSSERKAHTAGVPVMQQ